MTVWVGEFTDELRDLFQQYEEENEGFSPDEYDDVYYEAMTYDEFVGYIKEALRRHCDLEEAMEAIEKEQGLI